MNSHKNKSIKIFLTGLFIITQLTTTKLYSQKTELYFSSTGEFKILQFTDLHIHMGKGKSEPVFKLVKDLVNLENPDLVVLTGDITTQDSADVIIPRLAAIFAEKKVYWAVVLGNHDDEFDISRKELFEIYRSLPYNITNSTPDIKGFTNYYVSILGKAKKPQAVLYFFDSNSYNTIKDKADSYYDWFAFSQIDWYRNISSGFTKSNGRPLPALAFFHIPLIEYDEVWQKNRKMCFGIKKEKVASAKLNSGMLTSMVECGDVMGTFVGHDHDNDYIGCIHGIALAYGRFSGGKNSYGSLVPGARVIVLKEDKREFETWIRDREGKLLFQCQYPKSFISDKK